MWNLKRNDTNELKLAEQKETHRLNRMNLWLPGEGWQEGTVREFRRDMYTLLFFKWIINKDLL